MLLKQTVAEISSRNFWDKIKPLFCQDRKMDEVFKCQADWCLSNWKWWPSVGLFMLLRWLLATKGLVLAFRRWSFRTCKTMKFHWNKLEVTGKRMKFSVAELSIFLCYSVLILIWARYSVLCNLFFFSEHMKGWKRDDAIYDKICQPNKVLCVLERVFWICHMQKTAVFPCSQQLLFAGTCHSGACVLKSK